MGREWMEKDELAIQDICDFYKSDMTTQQIACIMGYSEEQVIDIINKVIDIDKGEC